LRCGSVRSALRADDCGLPIFFRDDSILCDVTPDRSWVYSLQPIGRAKKSTEDNMNKQSGNRWIPMLLAAAVIAASPSAWTQNVKVTPLGSHNGELCDRDRATIFEDPIGVRILYDAGQSVTGSADPEGGKLMPNTRMKTFIDLVKDRPVYLALSGKTMEFDANAKCVAGC